MSELELLQAGKICNVHGLKGTIKIQPWTDFPEVFDLFNSLIIDGTEYKVLDVKYRKSNVLVNLKGINTIELAEKFINKLVYCKKSEMQLPDDETYFVVDLLQCEVFEDDVCVGKLTEVISTGSADVYEITNNDGKKLYLAAIKENILKIDIKNKIIHVKIPEGVL